MNINKLFPSKYIKADDLNGREFTLTIKVMRLENVGQPPQQEEKPVLYFEKAEKGLILNRTNAMTIASLYTPETDNWTGQRITLYATKVKAFGAWHDAVRVKPGRPQPPRGGQPERHPELDSPGLDDLEDVADYADLADRDGVIVSGQAVDPDAPVVNPFDDEPDTDAPQAKSRTPRKCSTAQLKKLHALGEQLYSDEWDTERSRLVEFVTKGAEKSSTELTVAEANTLINGMERKLAELAQMNGALVAA